MGKIFVSYSRRDLEVVNRIVKKMERVGLNVWIDRQEIQAGKLWRTQIVEAIDTCDAFVLMLSAKSCMSDNVRKEIDLAQDSGRTIYVLLLNPIRLPADMRYQLAGLQYIDLVSLGVEAATQMLIRTVKTGIRKSKRGDRHQAELVIEGIDINAFDNEKRQQLLEFVAGLTNTPSTQLQVANIASGSVHVFMDMPSDTAFALKTLALNRSRHFKKFQIVALRLHGDRKYVNTALGMLTTAATIGLLKFLWLSIPTLVPSLFGVTVTKVILILSLLAAPIAFSLALSNPAISRGEPTSLPMEISSPTDTVITTASLLPIVDPLSLPSFTLTALQSVACRLQPSITAESGSSLRAGETAAVIGRDSDGTWVLVKSSESPHTCWVLLGPMGTNQPGNFWHCCIDSLIKSNIYGISEY